MGVDSASDFVYKGRPGLKEQRKKLDDAQASKRRVFMFFSVDLVNSTKFKTDHPKEWAAVFMKFYELIINHVVDAISEARIWKYAGDEVLFHIEVTSIDELLEAPTLLYNAMKQAQAMFYDTDEKVNNVLFFKGALWIAATSVYGGVYDAQSPNICIELTKGLDFLGVDVDEGFRLSGHTSQGKIALSPKIVYFLYEHKKQWLSVTCPDIENNVRFIDFVPLPGIWGGRMFPIIWYHDNWDKLDEHFLYDERYTNRLVESYLANPNLDRSMEKIKKIFNDLRFPYESIKAIEDVLMETRSRTPSTMKRRKLGSSKPWRSI